MEANKAIELLQRMKQNERRDLKLVVVVHNPGTLGGTPCVPVKEMHAGFDWNAGKVMISLEQDVTLLTAEQVAEISESVRKGQSWHAYQAQNKQQEKLKAAEAQRDELLAALELAKSHIGWCWDHLEHLTRLQRDGSAAVHSQIDAAIAKAKGGAQ